MKTNWNSEIIKEKTNMESACDKPIGENEDINCSLRHGLNI